MKNCVLIVQLEIPQIPYNLFSPSAQIGQLFGIFKKKALITCPLSMAVGNQIVKSPLSETQRKWLDPIIVQRRIAEGKLLSNLCRVQEFRLEKQPLLNLYARNFLTCISLKWFMSHQRWASFLPLLLPKMFGSTYLLLS